jgi:hypothetical protein
MLGEDSRGALPGVKATGRIGPQSLLASPFTPLTSLTKALAGYHDGRVVGKGFSDGEEVFS